MTEQDSWGVGRHESAISRAAAKPIRVLVVGNYPADRQYSMLRFADSLVENLRALGVQADLLKPKVSAGRLVFGGTRPAKLLGYIDKVILFPIVLRLRVSAYDCVHIADHSNASYRRFVAGRPLVVTCHDLFAVRKMLGEFAGEQFGFTGRTLQRSVLANLKRVREITCVSKQTADDFVRIVRASPPPTVIPNALSAFFRIVTRGEAEAELAAFLMDPAVPFFLHVGGNNFYKNRPGVVRLFARLAASTPFAQHRLVMAGKDPDEQLARTLAQSPVRDRIDVITVPSDTVLRALYNRATALLFVSLAEGFGWPILEAQACGCPVVTSDVEPMRTIGGEAALLVDPGDEEEAARVIIEAADNLCTLRAPGLDNVAAYVPESIYPSYVARYEAALAGSPSG